MHRLALLLGAFVVLGARAEAQTFAPLLDADRRTLLHEALSGEIAKDYVIAISRHHRIQGSRGYRDAAHVVLDHLRGAGLSETEATIESFPSDGRIVYQTWQSPSGWHVESAELRMLEPFEERLAGFPEIAMSLITYSNPGDVTAELVWVGAGTRPEDYEGKDVRGKFVLATGYGGSVHRLAVLEYGAAAVVCYLDDDRARDHPDMVQYTGMWPRTDELERVTFGFNLSHRQGERLRGLLESGRRVVLRGRVEGPGLEPYEMDVVVARIEGAELPDEELVFAAHLDHPKESANDNASGSAALLDIATTLQRLIADGRLPRPRRTLRFLWVPEWYGTQAYLDRHPEMAGPALGGSWLASLNLDMVGEHPELLHSRMTLTRTPASIPSALNDVVENMAQMVDRLAVRSPRGSQSRFNYGVTGYGGGSDHMQFIDRKIPGMMLGHSPDYTHHTSDDTPNMVDPVELERAEIIAAAAMLYLSDLRPGEAIDLAHLIAGNAASRVADAARVARRRLGAGMPFYEARLAIEHAAAWEGEALQSVTWFQDADPVRQAVEAHRRRVERLGRDLLVQVQQEAGVRGLGEDPSLPDNRVPVRTTRGPLDFGLPESQLPTDRVAWYRSSAFRLNGDQRFELVNFIDGERTVTQIRDALAAEFGPVPLEVVGRYLGDLVAVGVAEWR